MDIVLFDPFQAVNEGIARTGAFLKQPGLPERLSQKDINDERFDEIVKSSCAGKNWAASMNCRQKMSVKI